MTKIAFLRIFGQVQGVGLRYRIAQYAARYCLKGWIKNETNGTVVCYLDNNPEQVKSFISWLKLLKSSAIIAKVDLKWIKRFSRFKNFTVKS